MGRLERVDALDAHVSSWTVHHPPETVMEQLQSAGVAAGIVQNAQDLLEHDPQLRHREHYHRLTHPVTGLTYYMGPAFHMSATPAVLKPAPCLGEHNAYVYGELLGMSETDIERYTQDRIFY
jgi:benzylsuccinate CoA-transferase BbsF subunit